jgi:carboxymethylenebutenolidase
MSSETAKIKGETVDVSTPDGFANAYLARPDDGQRHPGVLFIIDAYGLRPQIERMTERIAGWGFAVLAPNVFYRSGRDPVGPLPDLTDPEQRASFFQSLRPLIERLGPDQVITDAGAYLDKLEEVGRAPVAVTGYCMGGGLAWRIAAAFPDRVTALACFHTGRLATDAPQSPHLSAGEISAEIYIASADNDQGMTPENIATLERALEESGANYRSEVYEGAPHGYTMADTAAYDEAAAERHFRELHALLERTIAA